MRYLSWSATVKAWEVLKVARRYPLGIEAIQRLFSMMERGEYDPQLIAEVEAQLPQPQRQQMQAEVDAAEEEASQVAEDVRVLAEKQEATIH